MHKQCNGRHLSPHSASKTRVNALMLGRGRLPSGASRREGKAGEGDSPSAERVVGPPHPPALRSAHSRCFASAFLALRTAAEGRLCSPRKRGEVEQAAHPRDCHKIRLAACGRNPSKLALVHYSKWGR